MYALTRSPQTSVLQTNHAQLPHSLLASDAPDPSSPLWHPLGSVQELLVFLVEYIGKKMLAKATEGKAKQGDGFGDTLQHKE